MTNTTAQYESILAPSSALGDPEFERVLKAHHALPETSDEARAEIERLAFGRSPAAMLYVADALRLGSIYGRDLDEAEDWYGFVVAEGLVHGTHGLGLVHRARGEHRLAMEAFEDAAAKDFGPSVNMLGVMYFHGQGVPRDVVKARRLWRRGARLGHVWSRRNLGWHGMKGRFGALRIPGCLLAWLSGFYHVPVAVFSDLGSDRLRP